MTLSVLYFHHDKANPNMDGIRCCADSLISRTDGGELTPHAMKIFKLNLSYEIGYSLSNPQFSPIVNHSIGFTFAGNLNVAMVTYSLINHLCEHFQPLPGYEGTFPSIKNLSNLIASILQSYTSDFAVLQTSEALVEIVLFGYCSLEKVFKAFYIYPHVTDHFEVKVKEINFDKLAYFAIGKGKKLLDQEYKKNKQFSPDLVRKIINNKNSEKYGVGGYFQEGWSNKVGIQLYCDLVKISSDGILAPFCGFNIPIINLETHFIGLPMFAGTEKSFIKTE